MQYNLILDHYLNFWHFVYDLYYKGYRFMLLTSIVHYARPFNFMILYYFTFKLYIWIFIDLLIKFSKECFWVFTYIVSFWDFFEFVHVFEYRANTFYTDIFRTIFHFVMLGMTERIIHFYQDWMIYLRYRNNCISLSYIITYIFKVLLATIS